MAMDGNSELETIRGEKALAERARELFGPLTNAFQQLNARQKQIAYSLFAVVAIGIVAIVFLTSRTDWKTLFAGLDPQDAREISAQLTAAGIPFRSFSRWNHSSGWPPNFLTRQGSRPQ